MENPVHDFGVILSRQCNARCGHCGSSSGPDRRERIDADVACRAIREASATGISSLVITGGEPFLHRELLTRLVTAAAHVGMSVAVCTNGWWGADPARARTWLSDLAGRGLRRLFLSTDRWHLPSVPLDAVIGSARAGEALGLDVQVAIPAARNDWVALDLLSQLRSRTSARVYTHPAHPVGRGASLPSGLLQPRPPVHGPCHLVGHLEIDVDGSFSVCPTSGEFPPQSVLRLGNVGTESIGVLVERYRRTPLYWLIATHGPVGVALLAQAAGVAVPSAAHDCILCEALHRDRAYVAAIAERLGIALMDTVQPVEFAAVVDETEALLRAATGQPVEIRV